MCVEGVCVCVEGVCVCAEGGGGHSKTAQEVSWNLNLS